MKRLSEVNRRSTFAGVSVRRQPPPEGRKPRGLGASSPQGLIRDEPGLCNEPRSTYPFELRHAFRGRVPLCHIRAAAHVGRRRCRRVRPRPTPTFSRVGTAHPTPRSNLTIATRDRIRADRLHTGRLRARYGHKTERLVLLQHRIPILQHPPRHGDDGRGFVLLSFDAMKQIVIRRHAGHGDPGRFDEHRPQMRRSTTADPTTVMLLVAVADHRNQFVGWALPTILVSPSPSSVGDAHPTISAVPTHRAAMGAAVPNP